MTIVIYSPRPTCTICGELMESWNPWIPAEKQEHARCAGEALGEKIGGDLGRAIVNVLRTEEHDA